MARAAQDKSYRSFIRGLITESTDASFPENSVQAIDNMDLEPKGTARRRLGLDQIANGTVVGLGRLSSDVYTDPEALGGTGYHAASGPLQGSAGVDKEEMAVSVHTWANPGNRSDLNFLVIQVGNRLIIRNWDGNPVTDTTSILEHTLFTTLDLDDPVEGFVWGHPMDAARTTLDSSSGDGRLFLTSSTIYPCYLAYDDDPDEPGQQRVFLRPVGWDEDNPNKLWVRDYTGIQEYPLSAHPDTSDDAVRLRRHRYDLMNQGWTEDRIDDYITAEGEYPANNQQWILGKDAEDDFSISLLKKQDFGSSPAPRGRGVLHALRANRLEVEGFESPLSFDATLDPGWIINPSISFEIDDPPNVSVTSFRTTCFFAGRAWFAGDTNYSHPSRVYFSRTIRQAKDAGTFASDNDPTSEHFPDPLDTDGGYISVTEADTILKLVPFGAGLLVMATNGIWFIYGGESGFTALAYAVEKVSSTGLISGLSVVPADQAVFYWADNSIHAISLPEQGVIPVVQDIGAQTVFSFYAQINREARERAQGTYDSVGKKVFWSYLEQDEYDFPRQQCVYNRMLILDTRTGAFTVYSFELDDENFIGNGWVFPKRSATAPQQVEFVTDSEGEVVTDSEDNDVFVLRDAGTINEFVNSVYVLILDGSVGGVRVGEFIDSTFMDYRLLPGREASDYVSYLTTAPEILEDLTRVKKATYVHNFFRRTETGFSPVAGGLAPTNPSACTVQGRWDWHDSAAGGRWSNPQKAYRYRRPYAPTDSQDTFDTGEKVVYTKVKMRGKGRALALHYESEAGKDFQLIGFAVNYTANGAA